MRWGSRGPISRCWRARLQLRPRGTLDDLDPRSKRSDFENVNTVPKQADTTLFGLPTYLVWCLTPACVSSWSRTTPTLRC